MNEKIAREGLTFDDVLLIPSESKRTAERGQSRRPSVNQKNSIKIPILSAAMDTVTEGENGYRHCSRRRDRYSS